MWSLNSSSRSAGIQYSEDRPASDLMHVELIEVGRLDIEPGHVPDPRRLQVPVAGNRRRVFLVEHGIEDRLFGQARPASGRAPREKR